MIGRGQIAKCDESLEKLRRRLVASPNIHKRIFFWRFESDYKKS